MKIVDFIKLLNQDIGRLVGGKLCQVSGKNKNNFSVLNKLNYYYDPKLNNEF